MSRKYTVGIDFGTLSVRAVLVEIYSGKVIADSVFEYPHAVMDVSLPSGKALPADFALQHPADYLEGFGKTVSAISQACRTNTQLG